MNTFDEFISSDFYLKNFHEQLKGNNFRGFEQTKTFEKEIVIFMDKIMKSKNFYKKEMKRQDNLIKNCEKELKRHEKVKNNVKEFSNEDYLNDRLIEFKKYGINPFPPQEQIEIYSLDRFTNEFKELENNQYHENKINIFGRVIQKRKSSKKLIFYKIESNNIFLQIMANMFKYHDENDFLIINQLVKRGDLIQVNGYPHRTKTGELSIVPYKLEIKTPCLYNLPKNVGHDINKETRFRNRHLDWILNPENRNILKTRSKIIKFIRNYLDDLDFMEVETPTLNLVSAGANAKPFETYINAFKLPMFLRIAPELKLKQMIIGGFDRVYEIGKQFRNEDVDRTHLPEFTSIEFYMKLADYETLMRITEDMLSKMAMEINQSYKLKYNLNDEIVEIDFTPPFRRLDMKIELEKRIIEKIPDFRWCDNMFSEETRLYLLDIVNRLNISCSEPYTTARLLDKLVGELLEPECINPTFIINHFQVMSPLAKYSSVNLGQTERFELFVGGRELCNAFTELNDPIYQENLFKKQMEDKKLGDEEAQMKDDDYITAMKYGLPPTGGWGMGIDRLVMFMTNKDSIREVVSYPTMKPL